MGFGRKYNERGFDSLINEKILKVDTSAINVVHIHCESGKIVSIDADASHYKIPIIQVADYPNPGSKMFDLD